MRRSKQRLHDGDRVRAIEDPEFRGPWTGLPTGTVVGNPSLITTVQGPEHIYWVLFDEPQRDLDGDGPYTRSQILDRYLEGVDS